MSTVEAIQIAMAVYDSNRTASEGEIYTALRQQGIADALSGRLVEFVPEAFARYLLDRLKVQFEDYFIRRDGNREIERKKFEDEPVFSEAYSMCRELFNSDRQELFLHITKYSSSMNVVNKMVAKGSKPKDIMIVAPILLWPIERGD